ncbi:hypothetical protein [Nonomuraea jabiensis]|uniref:hypothetical protein n=1 Tax=Nonomuraea jabiensis TaxID=882448 RepID=UPI003D71232F
MLFHRGRGGARATAAGAAAVGHARQILRLMEVMKTDTRTAAGGEATIAGEVADGRADVGVVSLPMIDWHENCSGETRRWPARR